MVGFFLLMAWIVIKGIAILMDLDRKSAAKKRARERVDDYYIDKGVPRLLSNDIAIIDREYREYLHGERYGYQDGDLCRFIAGKNVPIRNFSAEKRAKEAAENKQNSITNNHRAYICRKDKIPTGECDIHGNPKIFITDVYKDLKTGQEYYECKYSSFYYYGDKDANYIMPSDREYDLLKRYSNKESLENAKNRFSEYVSKLKSGEKGKLCGYCSYKCTV